MPHGYKHSCGSGGSGGDGGCGGGSGGRDDGGEAVDDEGDSGGGSGAPHCSARGVITSPMLMYVEDGDIDTLL